MADELVFDWDKVNIAHITRHNVTPQTAFDASERLAKRYLAEKGF